MKAMHRRDYSGEFIVVETKWANGLKEEKREWVANPIENHHISGRAAVIVSDADRDQFDYARLQKHRGGLLGKKRLQTYISGGLWKDMIADFWVCKDRTEMAAAVESRYDERSTVYTSPRMVLTYPGRLYLIPLAPNMDHAATAVYIAAFDGHQEVFILGGNNSTVWPTTESVTNIASVMKAYDETKFILVGTEKNMPAVWRSLRNVSCQDYREWSSYCDV